MTSEKAKVAGLRVKVAKAIAKAEGDKEWRLYDPAEQDGLLYAADQAISAVFRHLRENVSEAMLNACGLAIMGKGHVTRDEKYTIRWHAMLSEAEREYQYQEPDTGGLSIAHQEATGEAKG